MSEKPKMATRSSARTKTSAAATAPTTRATRAKTGALTTSKTTSPPSLPVPPPPKKSASRKPLASRGNTDDASDPPNLPTKPPSKSSTVARKLAKVTANAVEAEREPIMAFLRMRPNVNEDDEGSPYLAQLTDTSVRMTDPTQDHHNPSSRFRSSSVTPSSTYTFSRVFPPNTTQGDFFTNTTLPLVRDVLEGQNALLFTYGVTNSGKTYTVQGDSSRGSAGILPRSLDVIFNSIEGLHGSGKYRPIRLYGVELADASDSNPPSLIPEPAVAQVLGSQMSNTASTADMDVDTTALKLDRNYDYTIWLSYAEVYNEKVFDLLASVQDQSSRQKPSAIPRPGATSSLVLTRNALPVKSSPSSDNTDSEIGGKYISGLRQFRVETAGQAKELLRLGQLHRRVFGTLANKESSRSHGMVMLKIMRCHRGEKNDPTAIQISRFTLVDLAGSERTKHTHTTGDRLKEAGNINNSLMVLGQCLQVLRSNQRKIAMSLSQEGEGKAGRMDTRDVKQALTIVPFRHSKLTEILMDYFAGDGRVVMIVNVNPYDTGYDENSHVMKFAALAREVYVNPTPAPVQRAPIAGPGKTSGRTIKQLGPLTLNDPDIAPTPFTRKVTISMDEKNNSGRKASVLEVLEVPEPEDETSEGEQADDVPINPLVDALFDEIEYLRLQLYESEMRCALVEAEVRDEVMREMETRMADMEDMYTRRLAKEIEQHDAKTDAKLDMLQRTGFGSPLKKAQPQRSRIEWSEDEEEEDVELSLVQEDEEEDHSSESSSSEKSDIDSEVSGASLPTKKSKTSKKIISPKQTSQKAREPKLHDHSDDDETEGEEEENEEGSTASESEGGNDDDDDDDEWAPSVPTRQPPPRVSSPSPKRQAPKPKQSTSRDRITALKESMKDMDLNDDWDNDDSMIIPSRKSGQRQVGGSGPRKVKRLTSTTPVIREEQIEQISLAVDKRSGGKTVRRLLT